MKEYKIIDHWDDLNVVLNNYAKDGFVIFNVIQDKYGEITAIIMERNLSSENEIGKDCDTCKYKNMDSLDKPCIDCYTNEKWERQ